MTEESPPRITFHTYKSCWVKIRGEPAEGGWPRLPRDNGLVKRFSAWLRDEDILPARGIAAGPGIYEAIFHPEDGERVRAWLLEQGCHEEA